MSTKNSNETLLGDLPINLPKTITVPGAGQISIKEVDKAATEVVTRSREFAVDLALALMLIIFGWIVSRWLATVTQKWLLRAHLEETFAAFLGSVARYVLFLSALIGAAQLIGVSATGLVAFFGAIGLAIAFALRNTLSHLTAGVMIMMNRPFGVGDFIEVDNFMGTVKRITLFNTEINTQGNHRVFLPNTRIWENVLLNHTYNAQRMVELRLRASYSDDARKVRDVLLKAIAREDLILSQPEPFVGVDVFDDYGVVMLVKVWVRRKDYADVRFSLLETLRQAMLAKGMEVPYNQPQTVPPTQPKKAPFSSWNEAPAAKASTKQGKTS